MTSKEVVGLKPKAAFRSLFNPREPVEAGERTFLHYIQLSLYSGLAFSIS